MSEIDEKQVQVTVNLDTTPILYTDGVQMTANDDGMVLDVMQKLGNTNQQRVVARIGMSVTHAKKLATLLSQMVNNPQGMKMTGKKIVV